MVSALCVQSKLIYVKSNNCFFASKTILQSDANKTGMHLDIGLIIVRNWVQTNFVGYFKVQYFLQFPVPPDILNLLGTEKVLKSVLGENRIRRKRKTWNLNGFDLQTCRTRSRGSRGSRRNTRLGRGCYFLS